MARTVVAPHPARTLMIGTLVPIALVGLCSMIVSAADSMAAVRGSLIATVLAMLAFGMPPLLMGLSSKWSPPAVMAAALTGYMILVGAFGIVLLVLDPASWLSQEHLGWTLFAATLVASASLIVTHRRQRILVYDEQPAVAPPEPAPGPEPPKAPDQGGRDDSDAARD